MHSYFAYILASKSGTLYVGVTNDLSRRVEEHGQKLIPGFTAKYDINRLVWFEEFPDIREAIGREKQIKGWRRSKKEDLIYTINPTWKDLSQD